MQSEFPTQIAASTFVSIRKSSPDGKALLSLKQEEWPSELCGSSGQCRAPSWQLPSSALVESHLYHSQWLSSLTGTYVNSGDGPVTFISVQFSRSVVSDSLRPHGPQHARPPCPSPTPGVHPNSCPLSRWCHATIFSNENGTPVFYTGRQLLYYWATREARLAFPKVPPDVKNWLTGKDRDAGKAWRREEKGTREDERVGWHHRLDRHEFE